MTLRAPERASKTFRATPRGSLTGGSLPLGLHQRVPPGKPRKSRRVPPGMSLPESDGPFRMMADVIFCVFLSISDCFLSFFEIASHELLDSLREEPHFFFADSRSTFEDSQLCRKIKIRSR